MKTILQIPALGILDGNEFVYLADDPTGAPVDRRAAVDAIAARALALPGFGDAVDARLPAPVLPPIERFAAGLVGDGVTDDSVAFKAAHDAAVEAGVREVLVTRRHFIPSATFINNVIFRGPGALLGTVLERVVPFSAPSAAPNWLSQVVPSLHLPALAATNTPVVCLIGDSRSTSRFNQVDPLAITWNYLQLEFRRQNPGKTFTFVNRAISGQNWATLASSSTSDPSPSGHPDWTWEAGKSWLTQCVEVQADVIVMAHGINGATGPTNIRDVLRALTDGAKVPDIIFVTPPDQVAGALTGSRQRAMNAGMIRSMVLSNFANYSIANIRPCGLIDIARAYWRERRGFDPVAQFMRRELSSVTNITSFPYVLPEGWGDLELQVTVPAASGVSPGITINLDPFNGVTGWNQVTINNGGPGGTLRAGYQLLNGGILVHSVGGTNPTLSTSGEWTFRITIKGSWMRIAYTNDRGASLGELIWNGPITRYQDTMTQPTLSTSRPWLDIDACSVGEPEPCVRTLTEAEMWGDTASAAANGGTARPYGGNAQNHETTLSWQRIHVPVWQLTNLRA